MDEARIPEIHVVELLVGDSSGEARDAYLEALSIDELRRLAGGLSVLVVTALQRDRLEPSQFWAVFDEWNESALENDRMMRELPDASDQ